MELIKQKEECCGCGVCAQLCPQKAITMEADACGFLYPRIDQKRCVDCGLCLSRCAFQNGYKKRKTFEPFLGFGARHKQEEGFMNSRSGGAFVAFSDWILANDGVIYGAGFDDERGFYYVCHKRAVSSAERDGLRKSKYVQSDLKDTFSQLKTDLQAGKPVLFTGTGCQVGALYLFLDREYENLYTLDIVCHGTPSPKLWEDFLRMREREYGGRIEDAEFRNKREAGWRAHRESVTICGKTYASAIYKKLFYMEVSRPSCHVCKYANKNRPGDITIADFWGHEQAIQDLWDDDKGISLVLVNNEHGKGLWEAAKYDLEYIDCTGYPFRHMNMKHPTEKSERYDEFWEDYLTQGFEYVVEKYTTYKIRRPEKKSAVKTVKKKVKAKCKRVLKKIFGS